MSCQCKEKLSGELSEAEISTLFRALASEKRRVVIDFLAEEHPAPVNQSIVVAEVAGTINEDHSQVALELVHNHFPFLSDAGLIRFEPTKSQITYAGGEWPAKILDYLW